MKKDYELFFTDDDYETTVLSLLLKNLKIDFETHKKFEKSRLTYFRFSLEGTSVVPPDRRFFDLFRIFEIWVVQYNCGEPLTPVAEDLFGSDEEESVDSGN